METTQASTPVTVVELRGPRQPCDGGLTSLGLLMQLTGAIGVVVMLAMAALPFTGRGVASLDNQLTCVTGSGESCACDATTAQTARNQPRRSRGESDAPILFLVAFACVARSFFHRAAGKSLVHDGGDGPKRHISMYTIIAAIHTPVMIVFLHTFGAGPIALITAAAMLLAWPITLQVIMRSHRFQAGLAQRGDASFEGIGVLLTALGVISATTVMLSVASMLQHIDLDHSEAGPGLIIIGALLLGRSVSQALTGLRLGPRASLRSATAAVSSYRRSSAATTLLIVAAIATYGSAHWDIATVVIAAALAGWLLWSWPQTLARLCEERVFAAEMERDEPLTYNAAADGGLVSLGWLILAVGVVSLAYCLPAAVLVQDNASWWLVALSAMELWAAFELLTMSDRHQQVVVTMGLLSIVVVLFLLWPQANAVLELSGPGASGPEVTALAAHHVFVCCVHLGAAIAAMLFESRVDTSSTLARVQLKRFG